MPIIYFYKVYYCLHIYWISDKPIRTSEETTVADSTPNAYNVVYYRIGVINIGETKKLLNKVATKIKRI